MHGISPKAENRSALRLLVLLPALALGLSGCTSLMFRMQTGPYKPYEGTSLAAEIVFVGWQWESVFFVPDIPLSFVVDTVLLPWDLAAAADEETVPEPTDQAPPSEGQ